MWENINRVRRILRVSLIKTVYINFYKLPFKQAIKLPIIVTRNTYFYDLSGKIVLVGKVHFGMIRFGFMGEDTNVWKNDRAIINLAGRALFQGDVRFGVGFSLRVQRYGRLKIGSNVRMNYNSKIICYDSIVIGNDCNIAWEVQIMDSDLHFIKNLTDNTIGRRAAPVKIGNNAWVGNRVSILKGSNIADHCIVASGSIVNAKSLSTKNSIIAGIPSKVVKKNFSCIPTTEESEIIKRFNYK